MAKLWKCELELVGVAVISNLLGAWNGFEPCCQVAIDKAWRVAVPPMSIGDHVGEDPCIVDQFLIGDAGKDGDREADLRECVEQRGVLNHGNAAIVKVLPLEDTLRIDLAIDTDHEIEWQAKLCTIFRQSPERPIGHR